MPRVSPEFLNALREKRENYFPIPRKELHSLKMGGLWKRSYPSPSKNARQAFVSIVSVVKDNPHGLEDSIQSVLSQSYKDKEHLIIDGGSAQETLEVLSKYEGKIDFWLSHADRGIYDAMNRGTLLARGAWLLFLNAGDRFYDSESLLHLTSYCGAQADLVYGDHEVRYTDKNYRRIHFSPSIRSYCDLWHHMGFCHQSLIVRKNIQYQNLFDNNNLSADYKFVLASFLAGYKIQHVPVTVTSVDSVGISQKRRIYMEIERWRVSWELSPRLWLPLAFFWILCSTSLRFFIQKILGKKLTGIILRIKYGIADKANLVRNKKQKKQTIKTSLGKAASKTPSLIF